MYRFIQDVKCPDGVWVAYMLRRALPITPAVGMRVALPPTNELRTIDEICIGADATVNLICRPVGYNWGSDAANKYRAYVNDTLRGWCCIHSGASRRDTV